MACPITQGSHNQLVMPTQQDAQLNITEVNYVP